MRDLNAPSTALTTAELKWSTTLIKPACTAWQAGKTAGQRPFRLPTQRQNPPVTNGAGGRPSNDPPTGWQLKDATAAVRRSEGGARRTR